MIMFCVRSVSYSIKINGEPRGYINPSRGICQGDPLSPYLFLLRAEGLTAFLTHVVEIYQVPYVLICRNAPRINHLFLADDSILFCKTSVEKN